MKIATILGTRPEIIRLSSIIRKLDASVEHVFVHTGQNYDPSLSGLFFSELGVREPDFNFAVQSPSFGAQIGQIIEKSEAFFRAEQPDRLLLLGDTNSALSAIVAKRLGIPVFHMEAGNRCFDDRVPEEVNRRIIDHCSDVLLPYTEHSRRNLLSEGIHSNRIFVTGNPIAEVIEEHQARVDESEVLSRLDLTPKRFFLITMHRAENVDVAERLSAFGSSFNQLAKLYDMPVIVSTHPRTRSRLNALPGIESFERVRFVEPFGFFDFLALEQQAFCVLSDSGTVQEECSLFNVPNVTIRDVTERPETVDCGSNFISGADFESILLGVKISTESQARWKPPREYRVTNVSDVVLRIITSYFHGIKSA